MSAFLNSLTSIGQASLNFFWFPLVIWTILALVVYTVLKLMRNIDALYQYHIRIATLAALPAGLLSWSVLNWFLIADSILPSSTKIIMVVNPITIYGQATATEQGLISQLSPGTWLGMLFAIILLAAIFQGMKFFRNVWSLHIYKKSMNLTPLVKYDFLSQGNRSILNHVSSNVQLAITSRPQVPSTFGWIHPVIVIPALLTENKTKLNLAIRHELTHIRRRDYAIGFWVHFVSELFLFHPLVHFLSKEINEYSEISCDDEVLADTSIPVKHYAYLLFEMLQLPVLNRKNLINMANPMSNIKKRINAMTITKHKNKSIGISFTLFAMILTSISLIMACSGLQNQDTSGKELLGQQFQITNPSITINGGQPLQMANSTLKGSALGIIYFKTPAHGSFLISGQSFNGALPVGTINGNKLSFDINQMNVQIVCSKLILPIGKVSVWVKHVADDGINSSNRILGFAENYQNYLKLDFSQTKHEKVGPNGKQIFVVVEKMPKLIGGLASIQSRLQYPELARKRGVQGRVYVQFIVDNNGNVVDPKIIRGIGSGCDQEALKVVKQAHFIPATQRGHKVNVLYSLPIVFKLNN